MLLQENVKVSGQHKQKIVINISMNGIKLIDLMTAVCFNDSSDETRKSTQLYVPSSVYLT